MPRQPIGPAFPTKARSPEMYQGITIRDYFAAAALTGLTSDWSIDPTDTQDEFAAVVEVAYRFADAMLAERAK